jgi:hypothetical protein
MKTINFFIAASILLIFSCKQKKDNISEEYYPDGTIKSEITVKNGVRNGITKNYDEKGRLISTAEYVNDIHEGWLYNYNPDNGKVTMKAMYKNDEQDGPVILYYKGGALFRESTYVKGRVNGIIKTYWPDGKLKSEIDYKMGKPSVGLKEYDKTGNLLKQPVIVFKEVNQTALMNKVILYISISDGSKDADFYLEQLEENKYFNPTSYKLRNDNGTAVLDIPVRGGVALNKRINIIAKVKTNYSNNLILQATYTLTKK